MINVGGRTLSLEDFSEVVFHNKKIDLSPQALEKMEAGFRFLQHFSGQKLIYGINPGFGPMAQYKVSAENVLQLQYNLIRSHSSGSGKYLSPELVKALMLARLNSLIQGYSGVHTDVAVILKELINNDITP